MKLASIPIGNGAPLVLIAGPCVLESLEHTQRHAASIQAICARVGIPFVFKASFDKANRSSLKSYRGPGLETGLAWLERARSELDGPVLTDVHEAAQCAPAAEVVDVLQVPAFLCRQTDLLVAAAKTGKPVNIKKAQFLAPGDMRLPLAKVRESGNESVLLTERGTSFGYHRLVVDFTGLEIMRAFAAPLVFDATHAVQRPGGAGDRSGGDRSMVEPLARAALAIGVDALFLEVHENPDEAPSDGPNMIPLAELEALLTRLLGFDATQRAIGQTAQ